MESKWLNLALLGLRLGVGAGLLLLHGSVKAGQVVHYFHTGEEWPFVSLVASLGFPAPLAFALLATVAESVGAILLAVGLVTRPAALGIAFTLITAAVYHLRLNESAELAALYALVAICLVLSGPGRYSIDAWMAGSAGKEARKGAAA